MKPYGYISNQLTGVLIDDLASIVWFPVPRYDSSPIFAKILDEDYGGEFSIIVTNDEVINTTQEYEAMNILVTTLYLKSGNKVKVIDLLSIGESGLIRKIENDVPIKLIVNPTFEYALYRPIRVFYRNAIQFLNPVSDDCIALIYDEGKR